MIALGTRLAIIVAVCLGLYAAYQGWKSQIYQAGYRDATVSLFKGSEKLRLANAKELRDNAVEHERRIINATDIYDTHYKRIIADRERLPIPSPRSCGKGVQAGDNNPRETKGGGEGIYYEGISEGTLRSIEEGQLACEKLLNLITGESK